MNDDSENPRFVETLYRRGYRFIGAVEVTAEIEQIQAVVNIDSAAGVVGTRRLFAPTNDAGRIPHCGGPTRQCCIGGNCAFLATCDMACTARTLQITSDNLPKDLLMTDGPRVYFTETVDERTLLTQVSASGGEISHIATPFANSILHAVSPLRSELLIDSGNEEGILGSGQAAPWIVPIPAGSPRRVGNFLVNAATWSRDGQLLAYSQDRDIYLAKWDGHPAR